MPKEHIKWTTLPTIYVNLDTGEQITKYQASILQFIKSEKHAYTTISIRDPQGKHAHRGYIQWTKCYREAKQTRLQF